MIGLCYLCGSPAAHTCRFCGRITCAEHFEARIGTCTSCIEGRMVKG